MPERNIALRGQCPECAFCQPEFSAPYQMALDRTQRAETFLNWQPLP